MEESESAQDMSVDLRMQAMSEEDGDTETRQDTDTETTPTFIKPPLDFLQLFTSSEKPHSNSQSEALHSVWRQHSVPTALHWFTCVLAGGEDPETFLASLAVLPGAKSRCGNVWTGHHTAYRCRTCGQSDSSCICVQCFQHGDHLGHDFCLYQSQYGGCCDCGDFNSWKKEGFCKFHPGPSLRIDPKESLPPAVRRRAMLLGNIVLTHTIASVNTLASIPRLSSSSTAGQPDSLYVDSMRQDRKTSKGMLQLTLPWLIRLSQASDGLRRIICDFLLQKDSDESQLCPLERLLTAGPLLPQAVDEKLTNLYLDLMFDLQFKSQFAVHFVRHYQKFVDNMVDRWSPGRARSLDRISVQLFTIRDLTISLVRHQGLLETLLSTTMTVLSQALDQNLLLNPNHSVLANRFYWQLTHDIRFVFSHRAVCELLLAASSPSPSHAGVGSSPSCMSPSSSFVGLVSPSHRERFAARAVGTWSSSLVSAWMQVVSLPQGMNPHVRELISHVEYESPTWDCAFALEFELMSLHMLLLANGVPPSPSPSASTATEALAATLRRLRNGSGVPSSADLSALLSAYPISDNKSNMDVDAALSAPEAVASSLYGPLTVPLELESVSEMIVQCCGWLSSWFLHQNMPSNLLDSVYDICIAPVSLHLPLHRVLSSLLILMARRSSMTLSSMIQQSKSFCEHVVEHPLRCMVLVAQIQAGMWRKNGQALLNEAVLYQGHYWHDLSYDLDHTLLQAGAVLMGSDKLFQLCTERFGLTEWLAVPLANQKRDKDREREIVGHHREEEHLRIMSEQLLYLIHSLLNLNSRVSLSDKDLLRQELIHRLCVSDQTYSQLTDAVSRRLLEQASMEVSVDALLAEISTFHQPSGMEQGKYTLKPSLWREFNSLFCHFKAQERQLAEENLQRYLKSIHMRYDDWLTQTTPPLIMPKPAFLPLLSLPLTQYMNQLIWVYLYHAFARSKRTGDSALNLALYLLLAVLQRREQLSQIWIESHQAVPVGEHDPSADHTQTSATAVNLSTPSTVPPTSSLFFLRRSSSPILPYRIHELPLTKGDIITAVCEELIVGVPVQSNGSHVFQIMPERFNECRVSMLDMLLELRQREEVQDSHQIIEAVLRLLRRHPSIVQTIEKKTQGQEDKIDPQKRKAKARERQAAMLAKFKAQQRAFETEMDIDSTAGNGPELELEAEAEATQRQRRRMMKPQCVICFQESAESNPLGFVALLQPTRLAHIERAQRTGKKISNETDEFEAEVERQYMQEQDEGDDMQNYGGPVASQGSGRQASQGDTDRDTRTRRSNFGIGSRLPPPPAATGPANESALNQSSSQAGGSLNQSYSTRVRPRIRGVFGVDRVDKYEIHVQSCGHCLHWNCFLSYTQTLRQRSDREGEVMDEMHTSGEDYFCPYCKRLGNTLIPLDSIARSCLSIEHPSGVAVGAAPAFDVWLGDIAFLSSIPSADEMHDATHELTQNDSDHPGSTLTAVQALESQLQPLHDAAQIDSSGESIESRSPMTADSDDLPSSSELIRLPVMAHRLSSERLSGFRSTDMSPIPPTCLPAHVLALVPAAGKEAIYRFACDTNDTISAGTTGGTTAGLARWRHRRESRFSSLTDQEVWDVLTKLLHYNIHLLEVECRSVHGVTVGSLMTRLLPLRTLAGTARDWVVATNDVRDMRLRKHQIYLTITAQDPIPYEPLVGQPDLLQLMCVELFLFVSASPLLAAATHPMTSPAASPTGSTEAVGSQSPATGDNSNGSYLTSLSSTYSTLECIRHYCRLAVLLECTRYLLGLIQAGNHFDSGPESLPAIAQLAFVDLPGKRKPSRWRLRFKSKPGLKLNQIAETIESVLPPLLRRMVVMRAILDPTRPVDDLLSLRPTARDASSSVSSTTDSTMNSLSPSGQLLKLLGLPPLIQILNEPSQSEQALVAAWCCQFVVGGRRPVIQSVISSCSDPLPPPSLQRLPHLFQELYTQLLEVPCRVCSSIPVEPALCLVCGTLVCVGTDCCRRGGRGEATEHAHRCGSGTGLFLVLRAGVVLVIRGDRRCVWGALYLDEHGEEDLFLRRGRPLYLSEQRVQQLQSSWVMHSFDQDPRLTRAWRLHSGWY